MVTRVRRFASIYRNHRPWNTQKLCVQELVDDVNQRACPTTFDEIRTVVEQCITKGWIEWGHSINGEHILRRTELGNQACGYGADGHAAHPTPTITDAPESPAKSTGKLPKYSVYLISGALAIFGIGSTGKLPKYSVDLARRSADGQRQDAARGASAQAGTR